MSLCAAAANVQWRLTQATPLGMGISPHGLCTRGGRGAALQFSRPSTRLRVGVVGRLCA